MEISHIGIAVSDLDRSIAWYQDVLGLMLEGIETVESQEVRVAFLAAGESRIELIEPLSERSPIASFLAKKGEGIHHIAFKVENIEAHLQSLSQKGVRLIDEVPRPGAHGCKIAFLHPRSTGGTLMELCQEPSAKAEGLKKP